MWACGRVDAYSLPACIACGRVDVWTHIWNGWDEQQAALWCGVWIRQRHHQQSVQAVMPHTLPCARRYARIVGHLLSSGPAMMRTLHTPHPTPHTPHPTPHTLTFADVCARIVGHVSSIGSPIIPTVEPACGGLGGTAAGLNGLSEMGCPMARVSARSTMCGSRYVSPCTSKVWGARCGAQGVGRSGRRRD
eukprot:363341-Chlamydomonas_euryale.AAC.5